MGIKVLLRIAASALPVFISACTSTPIKQDYTQSAEIGWIQDNCLAIEKANLTYPTQVTIIIADGNGNDVVTGTITGVANASTCPPLLQYRARASLDNGAYFYTVRTSKAIAVADDIFGIGIIGDVNVKSMKLSTCSTSEGVQFTLSKHHLVVWKGYYYLGYDVEPTCQ